MTDPDEITPDLLLQAYSIGIFPMGVSGRDSRLYWVEPERRGIFPLDRFRVPKSLRKTIRKGGFTVRTDSAFRDTMQACADRDETWINAPIIDLYAALFERGQAHSVEVWDGEQLVGGLYGVRLGGAFFGESMFSRRPNASKIALVYLVARLKAGGFTLLDTQFVTDHLAMFGAEEIPKAAYRRQLKRALARQGDFHQLSAEATSDSVLHWATQTS